MTIGKHIVFVFALGLAASACGSSSASNGTGGKDSGSTVGADNGSMTTSVSALRSRPLNPAMEIRALRTTYHHRAGRTVAPWVS